MEDPHSQNEACVERHDPLPRIFTNYPLAQQGIAPRYEIYQFCYGAVVASFDVLFERRSAERLDEPDHVHDRIIRDWDDAVKSSLNHFKPDKREAARQFKTVFDYNATSPPKRLGGKRPPLMTSCVNQRAVLRR
jgi:hypothetical protein